MKRHYPISAFIVVFITAASAADLSNCAMCHKPAGKPAPAVPGGLAGSPHAGLECGACHTNATQPHAAGVATRRCSSCHAGEAKSLTASAHSPAVKGAPSCGVCHGGGHRVLSLTGERLQPNPGLEVCARCHARATETFSKSVHARAVRDGRKQALTCFFCHGSAHGILPVARDPQLAPDNRLAFCGGCHEGKPATPYSPFTIPDPRHALLASVHGKKNAVTGRYNAGCSDCHYPHDEQPSWNFASSTHFMSVPATCGRCHPREYELYSKSVHGLAAAAGLRDAPTCPNCHGDHGVVSVLHDGLDGRGTRIVATCSSCHYSLALSAKFEIPNDRVQTFERSYHGVVTEGGKRTAANCGSCHGVHDVLPASDPESRVYPGNLEKTCGTCHYRVTERFVGTDVHAPRLHRRSPSDYVAAVYVVLIVVLLGGMAGHNALDYFAKVREVKESRDAPPKVFERLRFTERVQHLTLVVSFSLLAFTGFAIKFPSAFIFSWLVRLEGPYPVRVVAHKTLAVILVAASVLHVGYLLVTPRGRRRLRAIWPRFTDAQDGIRTMLHAAGLARRKPVFGEFNYAEKAEYWALVWGTVVMAITGIYIWLDPYIQMLFPYWLYSVLRTIHFYEAILAVSAIIVWHLYHVIFDPHVYPMNFAWLSGKIPAKFLVEDRPGYLKELRQAGGKKGAGPEEKKTV